MPLGVFRGRLAFGLLNDSAESLSLHSYVPFGVGSDPGDKMVDVRRMRLWHVLLVVAFVVGAALWLVLVPNDDPSGNARNAAYWWSSGVAAVALGALAHSKESALVGGAVGVPALLLAGWTAPRGDGDGLWILWFPILGALIFGLSAAGSVGGWLASRALARGRS